uniref:CSON000814 protein n=1 Tax=Culicoides sonorensis TaxID=179676 RepID=A0A336KX25_CULSO
MSDENTSTENESFAEKAYNTKLLADCTFKFLSGKELPANRTMLALNSPVFYSMFFGGLSESKKEHPFINIPDSGADAFELVLKYIYTKKIELRSCEMAVQVYYISKKYQLVDLEKVSKTKIFRLRNSSAAALIHDLAIMFDDKEIKDFTMQLIKRSTGDIVTSPCFLQAKIQTVETIINECSRKINEKFLFEALETYAKKNNCIDALRKTAVKKIQFLRMTNEEIAECLAKSVLLTNEEKLQISICSMMRKQTNQGSGVNDLRPLRQNYHRRSYNLTSHQFDPKYPLPSGFTTVNERISYENDLTIFFSDPDFFDDL